MTTKIIIDSQAKRCLTCFKTNSLLDISTKELRSVKLLLLEVLSKLMDETVLQSKIKHEIENLLVIVINQSHQY